MTKQQNRLGYFGRGLGEDVSHVVDPEDAGLGGVGVLVHGLRGVEEGGLVPHY